MTAYSGNISLMPKLVAHGSALPATQVVPPGAEVKIPDYEAPLAGLSFPSQAGAFVGVLVGPNLPRTTNAMRNRFWKS